MEATCESDAADCEYNEEADASETTEFETTELEESDKEVAAAKDNEESVNT